MVKKLKKLLKQINLNNKQVQLVLLSGFLFFMTSCQIFDKDKVSNKNLEEESQKSQDNLSPSVPLAISMKEYQYAVVLGPGYYRTFAHAGVLRELFHSGIKISFIAGIEKASLAALLFADDPGPSRVEWQYFKWRPGDWDSPQKFEKKLKEISLEKKIENMKIKSMCPSYSTQKGKGYFFDKGETHSVLPMCFFSYLESPKQSSHSHFTSLLTLLEKAKQQGDKVIYIDVLNPSPRGQSLEHYFLGLSSELNKNIKDKDLLWIRPVLDGDPKDFNKTQDWIREGARATKEWLKLNQLIE